MSGKPKNKGGRPTSYTPELGDKILHLIRTTPMSLQQICDSSDEFPASDATVYTWIGTRKEFQDKYLAAKQTQCDIRAEYCNDLARSADSSSATSIAKANLMINTFKWHTSKLAPKIYGTQQQDIKLSLHEQRLKIVDDDDNARD